jgi:hypothetical protein
MSMPPQSGETDRLLLSLSRVGPNKPIGYLPLYTLRDVARVDPESIAAAAIGRGLAAVQFGPEECCIKSGALYVYDPVALSEILGARADTLAAEGVPSNPDRFVAFIAATWLEHSHPAYPIVAAAFGDIP